MIAPDLLGHGDSAKPRGDYSLGANASLLRDLLLALGHERGTIVGHSLGGGIAMQIAYQFPERVERLVLVSSGGLGRELTPVLRAVALPGRGVRAAAAGVQPDPQRGREGGRLDQPDRAARRVRTSRCWRAASRRCSDVATRRAFVHTARSVIDLGGQRVSAADKLYLSAAIPTLIVWGDRDPVIPARHGIRAHEQMPGSRLVLFEGARHYPHHDDPIGFSAAITDFVDTTAPSEPDEDALRRLLLERAAT